jgi:hypothetical protein
MNFSGYVYHPNNSLFSRLVLPVAAIAKFLQQIYEFLLQIIWTELLSGKKIESDVANLLLFIIFCCFSWVAFQLQAYRQFIIICGLTLWFIDRAIAHQYYCNNPKSKLPVAVKITSDTLYIRNYLPQRQTIDLEFHRDNLKEIAIAPRLIRSNAFEAEVKQCWQVMIYLQDQTEILIDEQTKPEKAFNKAKRLRSILEIPIIFLNSEGNHLYASNELSFDNQLNLTAIQVQKNQHQFHIYSQWHLRDSWQLLKQILTESGFIIFLMMMTNFMIIWGGLLNRFFFAKQANISNFPSIWEWFNPQLDMAGYLELLIAIAIILIEGVRISQTKHIYLDDTSLKYFVGNKLKGHLNPGNIEAILLISHPEPNLLILGNKKTLTIAHLPTTDAYRAMIQNLEAGMKQKLATD